MKRLAPPFVPSIFPFEDIPYSERDVFFPNKQPLLRKTIVIPLILKLHGFSTRNDHHPGYLDILWP